MLRVADCVCGIPPPTTVGRKRGQSSLLTQRRKPRGQRDHIAQTAHLRGKPLAAAGSLSFWQALPKSSSNVRCEEFLQRVGVVGKLPTTTGWQPVLPRIRETPPLPLWFGWLAGFCSLARFGWRSPSGCTAGKLSVSRNSQYIGFSE